MLSKPSMFLNQICKYLYFLVEIERFQTFSSALKCTSAYAPSQKTLIFVSSVLVLMCVQLYILGFSMTSIIIAQVHIFVQWPDEASLPLRDFHLVVKTDGRRSTVNCLVGRAVVSLTHNPSPFSIVFTEKEHVLGMNTVKSIPLTTIGRLLSFSSLSVSVPLKQ